VIRDLNEFFGDARDVRTILPGQADDFKQWLVGQELAPTTIHKRLQVARWFFHAMQRRKLIGENPFDGVKAAATGIQDRQRFVTREDSAIPRAQFLLGNRIMCCAPT
jgi:site-specific recombinase XerD